VLSMCYEYSIGPCVDGWGERLGQVEFSEDLNYFSVSDDLKDGHYIWGSVEECVPDYYGRCDWTRMSRLRASYASRGVTDWDVRDIPDNRKFRVTLCVSEYQNPNPGAYIKCSGWVESPQ
jgi:hypothetical protein